MARPLADVPSRHALRNIAEDLVRRAVGEFRVFQRIDAEPIARTQEYYFVS